MPQPVLIEFNSAMLDFWRLSIDSLSMLISVPRTRPMLALHMIRERARYQDLYNQGTSFLANLRYDPVTLLEHLDSLLLIAIEEFEHQYPAGQSLVVREALVKLESSSLNIRLQSQLVYSAILQRSNYLQYCGLLTTVYKQLRDNDDKLGKLLMKKIIKVLEQTYIKLDGDLPDGLAIGQNASQHFAEYNNSPSIDIILRSEREAYINAKRALEETLATHPGVIQNEQVKTLVRAIYTDFTQASYNIDFDKKFATNVLCAMDKFLKHPDDPYMQTNFLRYINHAAGKPSIFKIAAGLFLAVVGTTIMAGGFVLGITLIGPHALYVVAAGFAIAYEGLRLLNNGSRQGTSKAMLNLFRQRRTIAPLSPEPEVAPATVSNATFRPFSGTRFKLGS